jgi:hypothetical protein
MKFFFFDAHIGVYQEYKHILQVLYGEGHTLDGFLISDHAQLIGRIQDKPDFVNSKSWFQLNTQLISNFIDRYRELLSTFDCFIVGYPSSFALLFESFKKPIILVNCVRYDLPFCWTNDYHMLQALQQCIGRLHADGRLLVISNNLADHDYFQLSNPRIPSQLIPTLGDYACLHWKGGSSQSLLYTGESIAPSINGLLAKSALGTFKSPQLQEFESIVHLPYEVSTMSMAEHYSGGIPLLFPTQLFYESLCRQYPNLLTSRYWLHRGRTEVPQQLSVAHDKGSLNWWISRSDFYQHMPSVNFFNDFGELNDLIVRSFSEGLARPSASELEQRRYLILSLWKYSLNSLNLLHLGKSTKEFVN